MLIYAATAIVENESERHKFCCAMSDVMHNEKMKKIQ